MNETQEQSSAATNIFVKFLRPFTALGYGAGRIAQIVLGMTGGMFILLCHTVKHASGGLGAAQGRQNFMFQMVRVGVRAIPIIVLVELAIGVILPLQMFGKLDEFGQGEQVATITAIAAFRELGPLMAAIVLCGFAGASIAAEIGTMVTSEEIEALESLALNPVRFLVVPRLLATVVMMVVLTIIADVVMVAGGWFTATQLGIDSDVFYRLSVEAVDVMGFITGLIKAAVFGLLITLIACFLGLTVKPWEGSEGVGRATTSTVVYGIVAIIGADAVFTIIFYAYGLFE